MSTTVNIPITYDNYRYSPPWSQKCDIALRSYFNEIEKYHDEGVSGIAREIFTTLNFNPLTDDISMALEGSQYARTIEIAAAFINGEHASNVYKQTKPKNDFYLYIDSVSEKTNEDGTFTLCFVLYYDRYCGPLCGFGGESEVILSCDASGNILEKKLGEHQEFWMS